MWKAYWGGDDMKPFIGGIHTYMKAIKKNLHDQILEPEYKGICMKCFICNGEYSASKGDYWDYPDTWVFRCCDEPMELVRKQTKYIKL